MSRAKILIFSLLPLLLLFISVEAAVRIAYFQKYSGSMSGWSLLLSWSQKQFATKLSPQVRKALAREELFSRYPSKLFTAEGSALLDELKQRYEKDFNTLATQLKNQKIPLLVVYIPSFSQNFGNFSHRDFFASLSKKADADFFDFTAHVKNLPFEHYTLDPEDPHLSRYGNQLLAEALGKKLLAEPRYASLWQKPHEDNAAQTAQSAVTIFGDLKPNNRAIWELAKPLPFAANSNAQGLRNQGLFTFPKKNLRILALGDSYTFGLYLPLAHTYPELLSRYFAKQPKPRVLEVANAGIAGYSIPDELELYLERAQYLLPDLVLLQVFDNDLTGLLEYSRRLFARNRSQLNASQTENEFFTYLENLAP